MSHTRPRQPRDLVWITLITAASALAAYGQTGAPAQQANATGRSTAERAHPPESRQRPSPFRKQKVSSFSRTRLTLPAGTGISVRLTETLDSKQLRPDDRFFATLDTPITIHGRVIVPKGTEFEGHVIVAKTSGRFHGTGLLGLTLDSFALHGVRYQVHTYTEYRTSSAHKIRNAILIGGGAGLGAALGAVSGVGSEIGAGAGAAAGTTSAFITGKRSVKLPVETPLEFSLSANIDVRS